MPTLAQKWIERGIERGIEQGIERGVARGEVRGQARTLSSLILRRFGSVPPKVSQRISEATSEELTRFTDNIFDAKSAEEVVGLK